MAIGAGLKVVDDVERFGRFAGREQFRQAQAVELGARVAGQLDGFVVDVEKQAGARGDEEEGFVELFYQIAVARFGGALKKNQRAGFSLHHMNSSGHFAPAQAGGEDAQHLPVFGDGAPGDGVALRLEQCGDLGVGERGQARLLPDDRLDCVAHS